MTSSDGDDGPPDAARGTGHSEQVTVDAVKSAILDRLLADLGADRPIATPRSSYTKSDSGLYGKYEKQDGLNEDVLLVIRTKLDELVAQYEADAAEGPSSGEKGLAP